MTNIQAVADFLENFAPSRLAEDWDNVGLLMGDPLAEAVRVMTCLTITPASAAEAIERRANLIVAHHPLPFRPLKRLTTDNTVGGMLWNLARAGVAIYSPHTAFDSAAAGINQQLAAGLGLTNIRPLAPIADASPSLGSGRVGEFATARPLGEVAAALKSFLKIGGLHQVGDDAAEISRVAVGCGSAGQFLSSARDADCQLLVTGETNFHTCLEAEATGVALLLPGHYASERFGVERLADELSEAFPALEVWASQREQDPLTWV
ncbi:MAG: Nif3-like dinuclear metal center hexameric protein [Planctomycetales bacterium]|nr:Nif3-like dinuclear metal center hexameric protein [Planctomycetales bacterium]